MQRDTLSTGAAGQPQAPEVVPSVGERAEAALTNGEAAAALLAAGIGSLALGVLVVAAAASPAIASALTFVGPVGPLSGKTTLAVIIWLIAWAILHSMWRGRQVDINRSITLTMIFVALGLLGTFPPFYEIFEPR